jgi:uncharacterized DUF497 family protein
VDTVRDFFRFLIGRQITHLKMASGRYGIDFEEARKLWDDIDAIETISNYPGEERILRIGKIESLLWTAIFTHRGNNIRIISVRRARQNETRRYETESASNG